MRIVEVINYLTYKTMVTDQLLGELLATYFSRSESPLAQSFRKKFAKLVPQSKTDNYPPKDNYTAVRSWLAQQRQQGIDWEATCRSKAELARQLTGKFGWVVDDNALRKSLSRKK